MTSGIVEILRESSAVVSLVGYLPGGGNHVKVFPVQAPQGAKEPYILVQETSLNPSLSKGCVSDLDRPRYDVMAFALDYRKTELMQEACRNALDIGQGFTTDAGANFDSIWMMDRRDLYMPAQGQEGGLYVKLGVYECTVKRDLS